MKTQQKQVTDFLWIVLSITKETRRFMPTTIFDLEPPPKLRGHNLNVRRTNPSIKKKD